MRTELTLEFREVLSVLSDFNNIQIDRFRGGKYDRLYTMSEYIKDILENAYSFNFEAQYDEAITSLPFFEWDSTQEQPQYECKENFKAIITYLYRQYGDSYCTKAKSMEDEELVKACTLFFDNVMDILFATYDKYSAVIDYYKDEENKLLNGVKFASKDTTYQGGTNSSSSNSKNYNKYKDTPQNAVSLESLGDDYNTTVDVGEGEGSASGSFENSGWISRESEDQRDTPIERLNEIKNKYALIMKEWGDEFIALFWEE